MVKQVKPLGHAEGKPVEHKPLINQVKPLEYKEDKKEDEYVEAVFKERGGEGRNKNSKNVISIEMKLKLYNYVLIAMAVLLGFHLYTTVQLESQFLLILMEHPSAIEYINEARKQLNMMHGITFLFCVMLVVVAGILYKIEVSICKKIALKR